MAKPLEQRYIPNSYAWIFSRESGTPPLRRILEEQNKEMEGENQAQHMINLLVHDCHPWEEQMGLRGNAPKGIIASMNSYQREDVQKYFDEVTHAELPAKLVREARAEGLEYFNSLPVWEVEKTQEQTAHID